MAAGYEFSLSLLQAINDWQIGGNEKTARKRGLALRVACESLPSQFKTVPSVCFRQVALGKRSVWDLLGEMSLSEKISSWTLDLVLAKDFKGGVPPEGQGFQGVIFERAPTAGEIVVNLWALYRDDRFQEALGRHAGAIVRFHDGIGRYGNSQSEVILEVDALLQEDIHSLGGHSSSFDELVFRAAFVMYGRSPTSAEVADLKGRVSELEPVAGARWLERDSTHRVLARVQPHASDLREIKRQQERQPTAGSGDPT